MSFIVTEITKTIDVMNRLLADKDLIAQLPMIAQSCAASIRAGGKIMFCGNGGSAADSQHLAAELVGKLILPRPGMAGLALTTDSSALTAIGNDFGYEFVFSRQLEAVGRAGDVLVGISTSGRSKNVIAAFKSAKAAGITTIAMTGAGGGEMADLADFVIAVPSSETQKIQEGHIVLGHIFCALVEDAIHGAGKAA